MSQTCALMRILGKVSLVCAPNIQPVCVLSAEKMCRVMFCTAVCVIGVTGSGRLGLLVSPARRVDDIDVGLRVDGFSEVEEGEPERPGMDQVRLFAHSEGMRECFLVQLNAWAGCLFVQDIVPGDVFLAINDVPLFSFPTPVCIQLLDLSSRCQRRKLRIFRRGQR